MQSIISTRTSSPSRAHLFRPSIYHAVSHSFNPPLSHPSDSVQSTSSATSPYLFRYLSLLAYTTFLPSISHRRSPICLLLIVVPDILRAVTVTARRRTLSQERRATRHRSHPDPSRTSSALRLTVWLVYFPSRWITCLTVPKEGPGAALSAAADSKSELLSD